jgi:hypothetical protein
MTSFALLLLNIDSNACATRRVAVSQRESRALSSAADRSIHSTSALTSVTSLVRSTCTCFEQSTCLGNDKTP